MNNQYPPEHVAFLQAMYDMREAQRAYFKHPHERNKRLAIAKELKADALLEPYVKAGVIKVVPKQETKAPSLFDG